MTLKKLNTRSLLRNARTGLQPSKIFNQNKYELHQIFKPIPRPEEPEASTCKIFYACLISPEGEYKLMTFHCPRGTTFNQEKQLCDERPHDDCDPMDLQNWNQNIFKSLEMTNDIHNENNKEIM